MTEERPPDPVAKAMDLQELFHYLRRDLTYLEGACEALGQVCMVTKVHAMRTTLNQYERENGMRAPRIKA